MILKYLKQDRENLLQLDLPSSAEEGVEGWGQTSPYDVWKRGWELVLALALLILALPVMAVVALLVKLTSRGPALYQQTRLGLQGRPYRIIKFRTMRHNCEQQSGPRWSAPGDNRITGVGAFLRKTHLDELPQLWNVLRGEMSLIGPRPERPEFIPTLAAAIPGYRDRLLVRPGITGLAQVQLPPDTDLASVRRKLAYDLYYIRYRSLGLDVRILFCTALKLMGIPFPLLAKIVRVSKKVVESNLQALSHAGEPRARMEPAS